MSQRSIANGMRVFTTIWLGQVVSLVGSGLFGFAVGVWVFLQTGSVTLFALITLFDTLPGVLIAPFAGAIVDRSDRRWAMILGDTGAAVSTLAVALIVWSGTSAMWLLYPALALGSIANAFQWPAYEASIALLAPRDQLGRVNGMIQLGQALATVVAPLLGGILVATIGIAWVVMIDFTTFLFAIATLLIVRIPRPAAVPTQGQTSLRQEAAVGWNYIKVRQGLVALLVFFGILNFLVGVVGVLGAPLILSFASEATLGILLAIAGVGMIIGGIVMTSWGGPERRIHGVLGFSVIAGLFLLLYGLRPSALLIAIAGFGFFFCLPIINASSQVIWQSKVALELQGRVFATRRMIAQAAQPLAIILAGPLADFVFEPLVAEGGSLADSVGRIIDTGGGRGIGLMFVIMGALVAIVSLLGYRYPRLRNVEEELPDAIPEQPPQSEMAEQEQMSEELAAA